jgi:hypothetical protein
MNRRPHGTGSLKLRGRIWWIKYYHQGKPVHETRNSDKKSDAERLLRVRLGDEVTGRATNPAKLTILQICRLTEDDYRITKKKSLRDVTYPIEKTLGPLEWSWIDWEACEIKIPRPRTKNKQPRTVPIYGDMLPFLIQQKAVRDEKWPACPYVFF